MGFAKRANREWDSDSRQHLKITPPVGEIPPTARDKCRFCGKMRWVPNTSIRPRILKVAIRRRGGEARFVPNTSIRPRILKACLNGQMRTTGLVPNTSIRPRILKVPSSPARPPSGQGVPNTSIRPRILKAGSRARIARFSVCSKYFDPSEDTESATGGDRPWRVVVPNTSIRPRILKAPP